jgi:hypothetical protein
MPNDRPDLDLWIIGNPESKRIKLLIATARQVGGIRETVVSYPELLAGLHDFHPAPGTVVRIESPGESAETTRGLLKLGIEPLAARRRIPVDPQAIDALPQERGQIVHPLQWFLGFECFLQRLQSAWGVAGVRWMSTPQAIITAFDKIACRERWLASGLPVPGGYPRISTYADLRKANSSRHARVFVKLRYGYSAMGAVALEWRGDLVRAITTVETVWSEGRPRMFVSKRPRVLHREFEIAWLIDTLGMEEIFAEDWLPKARWQGRPFDLRIVTIGARAQHVVGRAHDSPFTNLNLDATRISRADVAERLGDSWPEVLSLAERAAAEFPDATALGLDILVRPCRRRLALLEANAFGDYLPQLEFEGATTYEAELRSLLRLSREAA